MPGVPRGAQTLDKIHLSQQPGPESRVWPGGQEEVEPHRGGSHIISTARTYTAYTHAHSAEILVISGSIIPVVFFFFFFLSPLYKEHNDIFNLTR